jgi:15-cis-phytoene synthase
MEIQGPWENRLLTLAGKTHHQPTNPFISYWAGDASLRKAYACADRITAAHSKSFYIASGLLPEEKRSAIRALYAFCRTVDDIVDLSSKKDGDLELNYWREVVQNLDFSEDDQVAAAWVDTLARYQIPGRFALQLIEGVARDLSQTRYETFDELATYCYGVASTTGLMSMHIVGFTDNAAIPYAIKLGVALQMTNILRDVGEDYRNGRLYLPREELDSYGVCESDIAAGKVTPEWRDFMEFQIGRTRQLYADSWKGLLFLHPDGRLAIGAASVFYAGILDDIERHHYDVFKRRARLSTWGKLSRIPSLWAKIKSL